MADYFEEMGWTMREPDEARRVNVEMLDRFLQQLVLQLQPDERLPPPASKGIVDSLPDAKDIDKDAQCPVCLKKYEDGVVVKQLPCKHIFHWTCISPWLNKTNSCPLCRHELPTDDEDYEVIRLEKIRAKEREKDLEVLHNSMFG